MLVRLSVLAFILLHLQATLGAPTGSINRRSKDGYTWDNDDPHGPYDCKKISCSISKNLRLGSFHHNNTLAMTSVPVLPKKNPSGSNTIHTLSYPI
ncbi:hypothetical protein PGT21_014129 [Puccinia graminis f. sp. tritici]|uniref:Uncharacterized protein n=1 Tax=Puccinia graminis f. sp. tritici TaxID=56615 RepID=A0A5B0Q5W8_PUCGR|nr:hypothetical protein PGT21_014129 [Puccinia graminis f. sp. tritici]